MSLSNYRHIIAIAASVAIAAATGCSSAHQELGQGNGALTSNSIAAAAYFPALEDRNSGRSPHLSSAHAQLKVDQHIYPPTAR